MICINVFLCSQKRIFSLIRKMVYQSELFLQWGSMVKFLIFCPIQLEFCFWLHKKCWHTSWRFKLEIKIDKKVIAKKRLTNLYEINSNPCATAGQVWCMYLPSTLPSRKAGSFFSFLLTLNTSLHTFSKLLPVTRNWNKVRFTYRTVLTEHNFTHTFSKLLPVTRN